MNQMQVLLLKSEYWKFKNSVDGFTSQLDKVEEVCEPPGEKEIPVLKHTERKEQKYRREYKKDMDKKGKIQTGVPEWGEREHETEATVWINTGQEFSKRDEQYQATNPKQNKKNENISFKN